MKFTADSIAALVNGKIDGNGSVEVYTFAKIEEGHPGALSFLANPKYIHHIYETKSSIVLVSNDFVPEKPIEATLIRVANPYETIAQLLEMVSKATTQLPTGIEQPSFIAEGVEIPSDAYVGAFAYIAKGAKIGKGAKIYPQAYIGDGCEIGEDTIINSGVKIYHGCKVGARCIIHSGTVIGADGFGFAPKPDGTFSKIPQMGNVVIEDDVEIGANTTIDRAMMGSTRIAKGVKLDNLIQIAHNVEVGENTVMAAHVGIAGSVKVGKNCMIGGQVGIAGHLSIGDNTQLGAQCGVTKTVKEGSRLIGSPAIPALEFGKQTALLRRLGQLFDRVDALEKESK